MGGLVFLNYFPVSLLYIIIPSYNENIVQIKCHGVNTNDPSKAYT